VNFGLFTKYILRKERFALANREFILNKEQKNMLRSLPSVDELKELLKNGEGSDSRVLLNTLFDANTFVELGAFTKRKFDELVSSDKENMLEGVICGYGAIDGRLVFAFAQDSSRMNGAIDENHAKKICKLYEMAIKNGAPVVALLNSCGADIFEGVASLAAYGRISKAVSEASGVIPQIAIVNGPCLGLFSAIASSFDFVIKCGNAPYYVTSPELNKDAKEISSIAIKANDEKESAAYARTILSFIPDNASNGVISEVSADAFDRAIDASLLSNARALVASIADSGRLLEIYSDYAPEMITAFASIGGVKCGVVATDFAVNEGRISSKGAKKAASFVSFCDAYNLPIITLVDSYGLDANAKCASYASNLAKLSMAYAKSENAKVTFILGHAIGAAFSLLGSKAIGADVAYALDSSEISALNSSASVAFAWNDKVTLDTTREELEAEWKASIASPVACASLGEIDDIISVSEIRARACSSLFMLSAKGKKVVGKHTVMPL
jgi:acetyl-CoA carboxylase carboxyltransferase component